MTGKFWKIGQLAKRTGLSVRTLHFYDEIGLLKPRQRTAADHRLYGEDDVARLQQIVSLRNLGFALPDIRACLDDPAFPPRRIIELQLARLREQIAQQQQLHARLTTIATRLDAAESVSAEDLLQTIEVMTMFEKYFDAEQREKVEARRDQLGEDHIREVEAEWPRLIAAVREEMERGTDPADGRAQALARRWQALVAEFTGGDPAVARPLGEMYKHEGATLQQKHGDAIPAPDVFDYIKRAFAAGGVTCP